MRSFSIFGATLAVVGVFGAGLGACSDGSGLLEAGGMGSAMAGTTSTAGSSVVPTAGTTGDPGTAGTGVAPTGGTGSNPGTGGTADPGTAGTTATAAGTGGTGSGGTATGGTGSGTAGSGTAGSGTAGTGMGGTGTGGTSGGGQSGPFKMLILSTALEFPHDSIPNCQYMMGLDSAKSKASGDPAPLTTEAGANAWTAELASDKLEQFTEANLKNYAMIFFCSPTGTVFSNNKNGVTDPAGKMAAFQKFVEGGGAWGGVHSATDFEKTNGFPWFTNTLAGAYFVSHDNDGTPGTVQVDMTNKSNSILGSLSTSYSTQDEWYKMNRDVTSQPGFKILQRLGSDQRPVTWVKEGIGGENGGRMFYTIRGHNKSVYREKEFRKLVLQGVLWATKRL